jgi:hypothetical protein
MNERIKQITGQVLDEIVPDTWTTLGYDKIKQIQYRTAELIVRECTRIIANQAWESRASGANGDWTEYNTLSRVAGQIKEHFGVEE